MRVLTIQPEHHETVARHCEQAYPEEGCGILLGRISVQLRQVVEVIPAANSSSPDDGRRHYAIPPERLLKAELRAEETGLEVVGYFHSHPDHPASPSDNDLEQAWPEYSYLIVSVIEGTMAQMRSWHLRADRAGFTEEQLGVP